jgi:Rrf2 family transcriptional regulator, iron-sulfur cluster assembly transcription factor
MFYSATTEYAVRALAHLATLPPGERMLARDLAEATGVPRQFLGKILHKLARLGLLESAKGRGGGFRYLRDPARIQLSEVVQAVEGKDLLSLCLVGLPTCDHQQLCPVHDQWVQIRDRMQARLHALSMADLGANLKAKHGVPGTPGSGPPLADDRVRTAPSATTSATSATTANGAVTAAL